MPSVTARGGADGSDVRRVLITCCGMMRTQYAVQVKCWKAHVHAPDIQYLRGSLVAEEHGLFVTTSDCAAGADAESGPQALHQLAGASGPKLRMPDIDPVAKSHITHATPTRGGSRRHATQRRRRPMTLFEAINEVLAQAGEPLHYQEIKTRILQAGTWSAPGQTPAASVSAVLTTEIRQHGAAAQFVRTAPGTYGLRSAQLASDKTAPAAADPVTLPEPVTESLSFNDAAVLVLEKYAGGKPMHYKVITDNARELGIIHTNGKTPEATMNGQLTTEITRSNSQGEMPRFVQHGRGLYGLAEWHPKGVAWEIEHHNDTVRQQMHTALMSMDPKAFETLVGDLFRALGFEDVNVTPKGGDGGVDVRGVLVACSGLIRTRYAVQVKRWQANVHAPAIQNLRGSLIAEEHGLFVTTSDYGKGAHDEAEADGKTPITLINGKQLLGLLTEHDFLGVHSSNPRVLELEVSPTSDTPT